MIYAGEWCKKSTEEDSCTMGPRPRRARAVGRRSDSRRLGCAPGGLDTRRVKWGSREPLGGGLGAERSLSQLGRSCLWRCYAARSLFRLRIEMFLRHQHPFLKSLYHYYPGCLTPQPPTACHYHTSPPRSEKEAWRVNTSPAIFRLLHSASAIRCPLH